MNASAEVPRNHPMRAAWEAYKASGAYQASLRWATEVTITAHDGSNHINVRHPHIDGAMWAAFCEGWKTAGGAEPFVQAPRPKPDPEAKWHGKYLTEDEIVADMIAKIKSEPDGVQVWLEPKNWAPLGRFSFIGMAVRNYYGLWHKECPTTKHENLEVTDGIVTDPGHPDNVSFRIIERVREILKQEAA